VGDRPGFDSGGSDPYDARAMGNPLRDRRTAAELASVGQVIEFTDKVSSFEGLAAIVEADLAALDPARMPSDWRESAVSGQLQFGFVDVAGRFPMVSGNATTHVVAVCQRCLEPFRLKLSVELTLLLVDAEQIVDGYEEFEVWELDEPALRPQDIVEELLIMAMPFSAMHDRMAECKAFLPAEASDDEGVQDLKRPFAALRSQMTQNKTDSD
jgi:uncharacterized metal-binding protein YceD (DUF177 family)